MGSVNQVTIVGHLGADPELKYTPAGKALCNLRLATSYKPREGSAVTEWHRVTCWDAQAENCSKFLKKGRQVYVRGRLSTRSYDKDGQKHYTTEIIAQNVVFLGGEQSPVPVPARPRPAPAAAPSPSPSQPAIDDTDDLAF